MRLELLRGGLVAVAIAWAAPALPQTEAPKAVASAGVFKVAGPVQPGSLLMVTAPAGTERLRVDGKSVPPAPDGRFLVGLSRDATGELVLEAEAKGAVLAREALPIAPRSYRIQRLPALGTTDTPAPEWVAQRKRETALIRAGKLAAAHDPGVSAGYAQPFIAPVKGRMTGGYGAQRVYGGLARPPHSGVDIAAPTGTAVVAPADGIVRRSDGPYLLEGNLVLLDHGAGVVTTYMHLSERKVKTGDMVRQGETIGLVGTTGRSTGPHLHWGLSLLRPDGAELDEVRLDAGLLIGVR